MTAWWKKWRYGKGGAQNLLVPFYVAKSFVAALNK
jgi:hypothetical protein